MSMKTILFYIENIIFFIMVKSNDLYYGKKSPFRYPTERYLNIVKKGYQDCKLDKKFLINSLVNKY